VQVENQGVAGGAPPSDWRLSLPSFGKSACSRRAVPAMLQRFNHSQSQLLWATIGRGPWLKQRWFPCAAEAVALLSGSPSPVHQATQASHAREDSAVLRPPAMDASPSPASLSLAAVSGHRDAEQPLMVAIATSTWKRRWASGIRCAHTCVGSDAIDPADFTAGSLPAGARDHQDGLQAFLSLAAKPEGAKPGSSEDLKRVAVAVEVLMGNVEALGSSEAVTALVALNAVMRRRGWSQLEKVAGLMRALQHALLAHLRLQGCLPTLTAGELLQVLRSLEWVQDPRLLRIAVEVIPTIRRLHSKQGMQMPELATLVTQYASLEQQGAVSPGQGFALLAVLQHSVAAGAAELTGDELTAVAAAFVALNYGTELKKPVKQLKKELVRRLHDLTFPQVARAARAFHPGRRQEQPPDVALLTTFSRVLPSKASSLRHLTLRKAASSFRDLAAIDLAPPAAVWDHKQALAARLAGELTSQSSSGRRELHLAELSDVVSLAHSAASLGCESPAVFHPLLASYWGLNQGLPSRRPPPASLVCKLAWALAAAGVLDGQLLMSLASQLQQTAGQLRAHELNMLFQAELAVGGGVLPPELHSAARESWHKLLAGCSSSPLQRSVGRLLQRLGRPPRTEEPTRDGHLIVDLVISVGGEEVVIEVNGPTHYSCLPPHAELGRTKLRRRMLERSGYRVVMVPHHLAVGQPVSAQLEALKALLASEGIYI